MNPTNVKIHNICVPVIMWSILVLLTTFSIGPLPVSLVLLVVSIVFYLMIAKLRTVLFMAVLSALMITSTFVTPYPRAVSIVVFVIGWVGQFYGHKVEGKKPSFLKDLLFLLIGPIWVAKKFIPKAIA